MRTLVIGGGIIGLSSAWYLHRAGHEVIVLDKNNFENGCSHGNAGMIVPSHFIPLAAPGMIAKGIRWMFDAESPFYIKPRMNLDLLRWGWLFYKSATSEKVKKAATLLRDFNWLSKRLYKEMAAEESMDFAFAEKGILMIYNSEKAEEEELEVAEQANELGIKTKKLSSEELQGLEPGFKLNAKGAIHYPEDAHLSPALLMTQMRTHLSQNGVHFHEGVLVNGFEKQKGKISGVHTNKGIYHADQIVVAGGSWTPTLVKDLGLRLPMQAGKGYSFTIPNAKPNLNHPAILTEAKVAVTPMESSLRFAGTMEIAGLHEEINQNRVNGILKSIPTYYPELNLSTDKIQKLWSGLRPCSPDGLPYIGKCPDYGNVLLATGHAMMGLSLGAGTGKLIQMLVDGEDVGLDLSLMRIDRFG
ncbi:MAG: NAD(P)/FAD-dependent oxidoreductase [Saprospiraceae bacterium]